MLRAITDLTGYTIAATDGEIGSVERLLFEDDRWAVRHIVVDVGSWLGDRRVLLSPATVERVDDEQQSILVRITREQVRTSPHVDADKPVSRQQELALHAHYGYAPYWGGSGLWGVGYQPYSLLTPPAVTAAIPPTPPAARDSERRDDGDPHLRSTKEVIGYRLCASDGEAGHVDDFILDDDSWSIRYLVVDTSSWPGGRRVLVPPEWVHDIQWGRAQLHVQATRETVRNRSEYRKRELAVHAAGRTEERVFHVNEIIGKSVVTVGNGEKLGTIADVLFDTSSQQLVGLVIGSGVLRNEHVLPLTEVQTVGRDAVLVRSAEHVMNPREWKESDVSATRWSAIKGRHVVTADGREIGHASDFLVEEHSGALGGIEIEERSLAGLRHRRHVVASPPAPRIGPDVIVVADDTARDPVTAGAKDPG